MSGTDERIREIQDALQEELEEIINPDSAFEEESSKCEGYTEEERQCQEGAVECESDVPYAEKEQQAQGDNAEKGDERDLKASKEADAYLMEASALKDGIAELKDITEKTLLEIKEVHKLYHNEYAGRLGKMQKELDEYHEMVNNRIFDDILLDIAKVYCDNEPILDAIENPKIKKQVGYIFDDIEQLLESYDVQRNRSQAGDKRDIKNAKIQKTIETNNPELNDTVERSLKSGFSKGNRVLIKEDIYVNVYRENVKIHEAPETQESQNSEEAIN